VTVVQSTPCTFLEASSKFWFVAHAAGQAVGRKPTLVRFSQRSWRLRMPLLEGFVEALSVAVSVFRLPLLSLELLLL